MKKIVVVAGALIVLLVGFFVFNSYIYNAKQAEFIPGETVVREGQALAVDTGAAAVDGPVLITLESDDGELSTIAVPSMGLPLCDAADSIADVYMIEAGARIEVRGIVDGNGSIVPCESSDHYLRVMGEEENEIPDFEEFPVSEVDMFAGAPAPVDLSSSSIGQTFRTRLTEGAKEGPNFAGSFTVVEWGCGTMCAQFAIVDARDGTIYSIPWGYEAGLEYQLDSRLLVINPLEDINEIYPDPMLMPNWLRTQYYEWTGQELKLVSVFKIETGELIEADFHGPNNPPEVQ